MLPISESDKSRLLSFIEENQLDTPTDMSITKFHANVDDSMRFFFYTYNVYTLGHFEPCVMVRYNEDKERVMVDIPTLVSSLYTTT